MFGDLVNELVHDKCADRAFRRGLRRDRGAKKAEERRKKTHVASQIPEVFSVFSRTRMGFPLSTTWLNL